MTWSVQLTAWALPPLLVLLLVLRDAGFLWRHRRERGAAVLLALGAAVGLWTLLHLAGVTAVSLERKAWAAHWEYAPAAAAAACWVWFALAFADRRADLLRWPGLLLFGFAAATVGLVWRAGPELFFGGPELRLRGGVGELAFSSYAPWHWLHLGATAGAVVGGAAVLVRHLARARGSPVRSGFVVAAAAAALAPLLAHAGPDAGTWDRDPAATGFAVGAALLAWGLFRRRLRGLGPVARTLVMEELRDPVVVLDGNGRIVDVNRTAERVLGLEPYGPVPLPLGTLWASSRRQPGDLHRLTLEVPGDGGDAGDDGEPGGEGSEPEERAFEVTITPLDGEGGGGRAALLLRDVTARDRMERELRRTHEALREANAELERLANTDPLTGLANRRRFLERLDGEIERADRYERPLSLILLDLDRFKAVNDTHGHAAGDDVLRDAARVLRAVSREVDLPARIGGEEMTLLLPETDRRGARAVAERIRSAIERARHAAPDGDPFRVTASLGVASAGPGARTGAELLQRADEALYRAKEAGRNRVVMAS